MRIYLKVQKMFENCQYDEKNNREERIIFAVKNNDARAFVELLKAETALPIRLFDERLSTMEAHRFLSMTDTRGKKRKAVVDAVSAVMILEDYMARRKNK